MISDFKTLLTTEGTKAKRLEELRKKKLPLTDDEVQEGKKLMDDLIAIQRQLMTHPNLIKVECKHPH